MQKEVSRPDSRVMKQRVDELRAKVEEERRRTRQVREQLELARTAKDQWVSDRLQASSRAAKQESTRSRRNASQMPPSAFNTHCGFFG